MTKNNDVWFLTGASKGLGLILAEHLLANGYRVAATSRTPHDLKRGLGEASDRFLPLEVDLGDEGSVGRAVRRVVEHFGSLDVVVNNAGYGQFGTIEEVSDAEARKNYDVNVFGMLNVLRATLPHLREQRSGHVFNVSSIGGFVGGFSGWGVYCSTKFAVAGLTESLHADLKPFGVKVTLVYPGYFRTSFLRPGSMIRPAHQIPAYADARASELLHADTINGNQPGNPAKAAAAMLQVYAMPEAPLHLFLGSDAVAMAESKQADVRRELEQHETLGRSTDY